MTIAESLNGKRFEGYEDTYILDTKTGIWSFPDNSRARLISRVEKCEPYIEFGITKSFKEVKFWQAL